MRNEGEVRLEERVDLLTVGRSCSYSQVQERAPQCERAHTSFLSKSTRKWSRNECSNLLQVISSPAPNCLVCSISHIYTICLTSETNAFVRSDHWKCWLENFIFTLVFVKEGFYWHRLSVPPSFFSWSNMPPPYPLFWECLYLIFD